MKILVMSIVNVFNGLLVNATFFRFELCFIWQIHTRIKLYTDKENSSAQYKDYSGATHPVFVSRTSLDQTVESLSLPGSPTTGK